MNKINIRTLIACAGAFLSLAACQSEEPEVVQVVRPIKAIQLVQNNASTQYQIPGVAKAAQEAELSFRVSGTLKEMHGKIGQNVQQSQILATLDKRDFEINVDRANASLAIAKASLDNAKIEYERVKKIQKTNNGVVSQSTIDQRQTAFESAKASYASAEAELNAASDQLSYATLKAPFEGVLVHRYVENYQDIIANNPIYRFVDLSKIEMDINLPENRISTLSQVDHLNVNFEAYTNIKIPAQVKEISNEASQMTRTYKVRLTMTPPGDIKILPGMSGYVNFEIKEKNANNTFVVPLSALTASEDGSTSFVWLYSQSDETVKKVEVKKQKLRDKGIVVTGLNLGDWIAIAGVSYLKEGQKVRLLTKAGNE